MVLVCVVLYECLLPVELVHKPNCRRGPHWVYEKLWDGYCRVSAHRAQLAIGKCGETTPKSEVVDLDLLGN